MRRSALALLFWLVRLELWLKAVLDRVKLLAGGPTQWVLEEGRAVQLVFSKDGRSGRYGM